MNFVATNIILYTLAAIGSAVVILFAWYVIDSFYSLIPKWFATVRSVRYFTHCKDTKRFGRIYFYWIIYVGSFKAYWNAYSKGYEVDVTIDPVEKK